MKNRKYCLIILILKSDNDPIGNEFLIGHIKIKMDPLNSVFQTFKDPFLSMPSANPDRALAWTC